MLLNTLYNSMARHWIFLLCTETELSQVALQVKIDHHYKLRVNIFHAASLFNY